MRLNSIEITAINILRNRGYLPLWEHPVSEETYNRLRQEQRGAPWEWAFNKALMIWRSTRKESKHET